MDSVDNYEYLGIEYLYSTSASTYHSDIISVSEFLNIPNSMWFGGISCQIGGTVPVRLFYKHSSSRIALSEAQNWGSANQNDSALIPMNIYGININ